MAGRGGSQNDLDVFGGCGVGFVDEAGFCVACFHIGQDLLHILGQDDLRLEGIPQLVIGQGLLGVAAGGYRFGSAYGQLFDLILGQILHFGDGQLAVGGHNQHQIVQQQILRCGGVNKLLGHQGIHLLFARGEEQIGGSALLNLLLQGAGCAVVEGQGYVGCFFGVKGFDLVQAFRQAGRGGNGQLHRIRCLGGRWRHTGGRCRSGGACCCGSGGLVFLSAAGQPG
ncbi:hypothetical protein D3C75_892870 [compost metagenome]